MPTKEAPGIGASILKLGAANAKAKSFSLATILSTLTRVLSSTLVIIGLPRSSSAALPSALRSLTFFDFLFQPGTKPNIVTTGPGLTSSTVTSIP